MLTSLAIATGLALLAIAGESLSDWQAQRFKRNPAHRDAVLDVGPVHRR